jgi:hypothetical protein
VLIIIIIINAVTKTKFIYLFISTGVSTLNTDPYINTCATCKINKKVRQFLLIIKNPEKAKYL